MNRKNQSKTIDADVTAILDALQSYKADHPKAKIDAYRRYEYAIRVRIVDPGFASLPDELLSEISMLVLVRPREMKSSGSNLEYEDPTIYPDDLNGQAPKVRT